MKSKIRYCNFKMHGYPGVTRVRRDVSNDVCVDGE